MPNYALTASCKSTIGIVAAISTFLAQNRTSLAEIEECQRDIEHAISANCQEEAVLRDRLENAMVVVDDLLPTAAEALASSIPMWGLLKKLSLNAGRAISKQTDFDQLDFSRTPVQTYVSRIQGAAAKTPSV